MITHPNSQNQNTPVSIKEDFPVGKVVIEVSAVDDDSGKNKQIQYSLASKSILI